jgi:hypothetical protein
MALFFLGNLKSGYYFLGKGPTEMHLEVDD